jgi:hypothetical protein
VSFDLPEQITIWNLYDNNDGSGEKSYSQPVTVPARIAYRNENRISAEGNQYTSSAAVYVETDLINAHSIVKFGSHTDIKPCGIVYEVRDISRTPSGTGLKKVWL